MSAYSCSTARCCQCCSALARCCYIITMQCYIARDCVQVLMHRTALLKRDMQGIAVPRHQRQPVCASMSLTDSNDMCISHTSSCNVVGVAVLLLQHTMLMAALKPCLQLWRTVASTLAAESDSSSCCCDMLQQMSLHQPQCPHTPVTVTAASAPTIAL
jgi:hypothetical protein